MPEPDSGFASDPCRSLPASHAVGAVARLRAGATPETAERELNRLSRRLQAEWPGGYLGELGVVWSVIVEPVGGRGPRIARLLALLAAGAVLTVVAGIAAAARVSAARLRTRPGGARGWQAVGTVAGGTAIGALLAAGTLRALGPLARWVAPRRADRGRRRRGAGVRRDGRRGRARSARWPACVLGAAQPLRPAIAACPSRCLVARRSWRSELASARGGIARSWAAAPASGPMAYWP